MSGALRDVNQRAVPINSRSECVANAGGQHICSCWCKGGVLLKGLQRPSVTKAYAEALDGLANINIGAPRWIAASNEALPWIGRVVVLEDQVVRNFHEKRCARDGQSAALRNRNLRSGVKANEHLSITAIKVRGSGRAAEGADDRSRPGRRIEWVHPAVERGCWKDGVDHLSARAGGGDSG